MKKLRWLVIFSLLWLTGCAAARLASLAGKAGTAGKVVSAGGKVATTGGKMATAGKVAASGAKVGVAAEGAHLARGGVEAAEAGQALKVAAPADDAARMIQPGSEAPGGSQLVEAAQTAVDLAGIELPSPSSPEEPSADPAVRRWRLSQGRALEGRSYVKGVEFQLQGFRAGGIPQVQISLGSQTLVSPPGASHWRLEGLDFRPGASMRVGLRSGQKLVQLKPWKRP